MTTSAKERETAPSQAGVILKSADIRLVEDARSREVPVNLSLQRSLAVVASRRMGLRRVDSVRWQSRSWTAAPEALDRTKDYVRYRQCS